MKRRMERMYYGRATDVLAADVLRKCCGSVKYVLCAADVLCECAMGAPNRRGGLTWMPWPRTCDDYAMYMLWVCYGSANRRNHLIAMGRTLFACPAHAINAYAMGMPPIFYRACSG